MSELKLLFIIVERDPTKRRIKPAAPSALLDFDMSGESSDDSDFRIEDHCEESDDDDSLDTDEGATQNDDQSDNDEGSEDSEDENKITVEDLLQQAQSQKEKSGKGGVDPIKIMICCACLGDRSDANNEIVECDGCGVTVHEGCYGVSENDSVSSTVSSCSTMPWFCEACRAGVDNPICELCPNFGGIFKETDTGKWVHLVCALYVSGVAFGDVDKLTSVTLFELQYSKWGSRACTLCVDQRFTRTGICINCDAGLCRTYFHVTCAQREGLLSEPHTDEADQADPFYAHCKLHSDKALIKKRRRNWLALELRTAQRKKQYAAEGHCNLPEQLRIQRKLGKYRHKYANIKVNRPAPWVPTQKMARLLTTSASVCRVLWRKAALSGVDTQAWALREAQTAALADVHRKWHIAPAFSVEFIGYYLDRNNRMQTMKQQLASLLDENAKLVEEQQEVQAKYDEALKKNSSETQENLNLKSIIHKYHDVILKVAPGKELPNIELLGKPVIRNHHPLEFVDVYEFRESSDEGSDDCSDIVEVYKDESSSSVASPLGSVPTPAALKAGVGFPITVKRSHVSMHREPSLGLCVQCGICRRTTDQHLLAKCDTCHVHYHLGCLNPPLTRMPKKTKLMGWQCSECDKDSSGSEVECLDPEAPRQLRKLKDNGNGDVTPPFKSADYSEMEKEPEHELEHDSTVEALESALCSPESNPVMSGRSNKKRRREKHHRYSPEPSGSSQIPRSHKRKRKRKSVETPEAETEQNRPLLKMLDELISLPPLISSNDCILYPKCTGPRLLSPPSSPIYISSTSSDECEIVMLKCIPHPTGEGSAYAVSAAGGTYQATISRPVVPTSPVPQPVPITSPTPRPPPAKKLKPSDAVLMCDTCNLSGTNANIVRCDECLKGFHFHCLDPPVKKSPKVRGYSWHCADCDPTESDSS